MDEVDSRILDALQNKFPLRARPYDVLASGLGISVEQLWDRLTKLQGGGVIRRIGASLDSHKFGYSSTLAAISVKEELIEQASEIINRFPEVTHSYLRNDDFNIWFTIIAAKEEIIAQILEQIRSGLSLENSQILNLPMRRLFKLDARFNVLGQ